MKTSRVAAAVLGGAALASLTVNLILHIGLAIFASVGADVLLPSFLGFSFYGFLIAALISSTVGLIWHGVATDRGWQGVWSYAFAGLLVGALTGPILLALFDPGLRNSESPTIAYIASYGAAIGALTGCFAWLIRRPDRDPHANPDSTAP